MSPLDRARAARIAEGVAGDLEELLGLLPSSGIRGGFRSHWKRLRRAMRSGEAFRPSSHGAAEALGTVVDAHRD
jgi:hypothetical protein